MRARTKRLWVIGISAVLVAGAAAFALVAIRSSAMFYYEPGDLVGAEIDPDRKIRMGGMVARDSVHFEGEELRFRVTDGLREIPVHYVGTIPDLFREEQGVIADGRLIGGIDGVFKADRILAKHDENYVPRELSDTMERMDGIRGVDE